MPSNHLILCHDLLLLPSIFPSIRVFSSVSVLRVRWPSIGVSASASVLPMNIQDCFPLGWTGWKSLLSKGLSRVFSISSVQFSSVAQSYPTLQPHELQHIRPPCPSPTPGVHSNSHPSSQWCHPTISSSVIPFSHLQSFPTSGSFPMSQYFTSGGQSIGVSASASVLPMNIQGWFSLGLIGLISFMSKRLSRVFPNTTVQNQSSILRRSAFLTFQFSHP